MDLIRLWAKLRGQAPPDASLLELQGLTGYEFEKRVKQSFENRGWKVTQSKRGADGGIDLEINFNGIKCLAQCKNRARSAMDVGLIRQLYGVAMHRNLPDPLFITTGFFTQPAIDAAAEMGVQLVDGPSMTTFMETGIFRKPSPPICPQCGGLMIFKTKRNAKVEDAGFFGCKNYSKGCRGTINIITR